MILRLSRCLVLGGALATVGCQNTLDRPARFAGGDSFETRLSIASDDPAGLETGRGHSPSLASELADRRHQADDFQHSAVAVERLLERGHDADSHGRTNEAKKYYEQVLSQQPDHAEAHHRLAILADRVGDFGAAELHYREALKANPGDADVLNDLGYSCFLQGRAADSERYLTQAQRINPRHPHVQENLSLLYDPQKAERVLLTVMGPHQTQATIEKLFDGFSGGVPQPAGQSRADRPSINVTEITPAGSKDLRQQLADAPRQDDSHRPAALDPAQTGRLAQSAGDLPQLPGPYPQIPTNGFGSPEDSAERRIPDGFRPMDNAGLAQIDSSSHGRTPNQRAQAAWRNEAEKTPETAASADPRPAYPQWTTPPVAWPGTLPESRSYAMIEQASYSEPAVEAVVKQPRASSAAMQRAAQIGMAAGPGVLFPPIEEAGESGPICETAWTAEAHSDPMHGGRNPLSGEDRSGASEADIPKRAVQNPETYQNPPHISPGRFDASGAQPWPADRRDSYETRQDLPIIVPQQPVSRSNTQSGEAMPQTYPELQNGAGNW